MSESTRYELSARYFSASIRFTTTSPRAIRDPHGEPRTTTPLTSLTSSSIRNFHFKDTALYNLTLRHQKLENAFDMIWKTWYPRRDISMDKNPNAFFCRAMRSEGDDGGVEVKEVVGFHEELVRVADEDEEERKRVKAEGGEATMGKKARMLNGGLEGSFRKVFVVLDKEEWEKDGVLVVCREESVEEFGLGGDEGEGNGEELLLDGGWVAFRKGLEEAVETVICDPERKKAEAPTLEYYREKKFGY